MENVNLLCTRLRGTVKRLSGLNLQTFTELKWQTTEDIVCALLEELGSESATNCAKQREQERRDERRQGMTREEKIQMERAHRDVFARVALKEANAVGLGQVGSVLPGKNPLTDRKFAFHLISLLLHKVRTARWFNR